ncbi:MAG: 1-acyl-sn-glycerol-3-phosphate acyltransferase [Bacteroidia bacterium]|nr:1-acyl-sn-glycerol-3-phosphate acyltransferase [Bacteroidia bacterium]
MPVKSSDNKFQLIDIEKIFASKDSRLLKRIPKFLIRYLKKIVHQDEINAILIQNDEVEGIDFVRHFIEYMDIKIEVLGSENVPKDSRLIFAANHPLGGLDGMCLLKAIHEQIQANPKSLSNDLLMNIKPLRSFLIGVNKHGGNSKDSVAEIRRVFEGRDPVIFFASGLVSRRRWFKIEDVDWKSTFVKKSFLHERDVIPVFISGRVSGFFYRLANLRKFLGIRNNIEMLYLPNEMFKQKGIHLTIKFGKPIHWRSFNSSKSPEQWAADVKKQVYDMGRAL